MVAGVMPRGGGARDREAGFSMHIGVSARSWLSLARSATFAVTTFAATTWAVTTPAHAAGQLHIYNWTDYTAPAVIAKFEKETGVAVTIDTYDSNETLLAKLKGGSAGYDLVVVTSDFVPIFSAQGLLRKIDAPGLKGFANIEARWRSPAFDAGNAYTVPYHWGVTGFAINTKVVPGPVDSLKTLFEPPPEARGKVGMLAAPSEVMSLAELSLGMPPCQTDLANVKRVDALLQAQRDSVKVYSSDGVIERIASGETAIQEIWNGDAARARANNPDIRFVYPKEGVAGWMDNLAVPADARDPDEAKLFLEFMLRPENSALSSDFTHYASAIAGAEALTAPELRDAPELRIPPGTNIVFTPTCPAPAIKLIDRVWTRLRR